VLHLRGSVRHGPPSGSFGTSIPKRGPLPTLPTVSLPAG